MWVSVCVCVYLFVSTSVSVYLSACLEGSDKGILSAYSLTTVFLLPMIEQHPEHCNAIDQSDSKSVGICEGFEKWPFLVVFCFFHFVRFNFYLELCPITSVCRFTIV